MAGKSLRSIRFRSIKMKGRVLISEPFMPDPTFMRSVVLIAEDDKNGTVGFVLNQQTTHRVDSIVEGIQGLNNLAYQGGPVELQSFHYIHKVFLMINHYLDIFHLSRQQHITCFPSLVRNGL